jgi:hypothetical protein
MEAPLPLVIPTEAKRRDCSSVDLSWKCFLTQSTRISCLAELATYTYAPFRRESWHTLATVSTPPARKLLLALQPRALHPICSLRAMRPGQDTQTVHRQSTHQISLEKQSNVPIPSDILRALRGRNSSGVTKIECRPLLSIIFLAARS